MTRRQRVANRAWAIAAIALAVMAMVAAYHWIVEMIGGLF